MRITNQNNLTNNSCECGRTTLVRSDTGLCERCTALGWYQTKGRYIKWKTYGETPLHKVNKIEYENTWYTQPGVTEAVRNER